MENRFLIQALLISLLVHVLVLTKFSYLETHSFYKRFKNIEVRYLKTKPIENVDPNRQEKKETPKTAINRKPSMRVHELTKATTPSKDILKLLEKLESPTKQVVQVGEPQAKRKISVPPLKSEKLGNPFYVSYYQVVRSKIRERAYSNYSKLDTGEVYLTFSLSSDGVLKQIKLIDERTSANDYLKDVSLRSVQEANPFPSFPKDLPYPELTFNVVISFEMEP